MSKTRVKRTEVKLGDLKVGDKLQDTIVTAIRKTPKGRYLHITFKYADGEIRECRFKANQTVIMYEDED